MSRFRSNRPAKAVPLLLACTLSVLGCERTPEPAPSAAPAKTEEAPSQKAPLHVVTPPPVATYDVPLRSDQEFRDAALAACQASRADRRPLLLEAGADWCGDCRLLHRMKEAEGPLKSELQNWQVLAVNLGEDRHEWLRAAFGIKAIARWLVFWQPDCDAPIESWTPTTSKVVEPTSGGDAASGERLASWLSETRKAGAKATPPAGK